MLENFLLVKNKKLKHDPVYWLKRQGKLLVETVILYVLYAGIYQLYHLDADIREEIGSWRLGRVYEMKCSGSGPGLCFMRKRDGLCRIAGSSHRQPDVIFQFKSPDQAFQVVTGLISVADAYARHAFSLSGDIGYAMSFARVIDRTETYLFPRVMTRRILKRQEKRQVPMLYVYLCIASGVLKGTYRSEL